ncbi:MAG: dihydrolipoamide acetyltransferase family protein [Solirubrobacteraceae bacterium]
MGEFRMPTLGADMESGTLLEWRVAPGDVVHRGDIIATVDTSKAEIDVEVFEDGVVDELLVGVGTRVPVGTPLARIRTAEEAEVAVGAEAAAPAPVVAEPAVAAPAPPAPVAEAAPPGAPRHRVSPLARRMAADLHVDLGAVHGSGPGGAIVAADVQRAAAPPPPAAAPAPAAPPPPAGADGHGPAMRAALAALMARSKREVPHYYLRSDIDLSEPLEHLRRANRERPVAERVLPAALLLRAAARAARDEPLLNGFWVDGAHRPSAAVHLCVAIALRGGGLAAPAIHDADAKTAAELMAALRDLVARTRGGGLRASEMADPTITVTNLGDLGSDEVFGVIYPPQVALVGFGAIRERPWARDGMVGVRPVVTATLSADHRASSGAEGARFLAALERHLHDPEDEQ